MSARIVFMGSPSFSVPTLELVHQHFQVVQVWTQPDRPAGRGRKLTPCPVKARALELGLDAHSPTKMRSEETEALLASAEADAAVVVAYGRILPPNLLATPKKGCLNIHASLLPRHRGAAPIHHALLAGDKETGVGIMQMEEGLDTGPVFAEARTPIGPKETTGILSERLSHLGAQLLVETLPKVLDGSLPPRAQAEEGSTYASKLAKADGALDFGESAKDLDRRIRAMNPWPMAYAEFSEGRVQILEAEPCDASGEAGKPLLSNANEVILPCAEGALRLLRVKPAGKKAMAAIEWYRGLRA